MALILAIESDRRQINQLTAMVRGRLHAELVLGDTAESALDQLGERIPDLVLTSPLLSPKDEHALGDRLRSLNGVAAHVQTLTIPVLAAPQPRSGGNGRGVLSVLLRERIQPAAPDGCDPAVFADQCKEYLRRAAEEREARRAEQHDSAEETILAETDEAAGEPAFDAWAETSADPGGAIEALPGVESFAVDEPMTVAQAADVEETAADAAFVEATEPVATTEALETTGPFDTTGPFASMEPLTTTGLAALTELDAFAEPVAATEVVEPMAPVALGGPADGGAEPLEAADLVAASEPVDACEPVAAAPGTLENQGRPDRLDAQHPAAPRPVVSPRRPPLFGFAAPVSLMAAIAELEARQLSDVPRSSEADLIAAAPMPESAADTRTFQYIDVDLSDLLDQPDDAASATSDELEPMVYDLSGADLDTDVARGRIGEICFAVDEDRRATTPATPAVEAAASEGAGVSASAPALGVDAAPVPRAAPDEFEDWRSVTEALKRQSVWPRSTRSKSKSQAPLMSRPVSPARLETPTQGRPDAARRFEPPAPRLEPPAPRLESAAPRIEPPAPRIESSIPQREKPAAWFEPSKPRAEAARADKRARGTRSPDKPLQDEWGFFDPDQCGLAALFAKLDQVSEEEDATTLRPA